MLTVFIDTADSSDHAGAAHAIAEGLASTHSPSNPAYYIHISGTGILCWYDSEHSRYGEAPLPEQAYDDLDGIDAVTSLPDQAWHRDVDKIVLAEAARDPGAVKIAIVCPPTIYGVGRGPVHQRSRQVPLLIALTLERGTAPVIGNGLTEWDNIHVHDLSGLIVLLAQQAVRHGPNSDEQEIFGPKGYYFCENGRHKWSELAEMIAKEANKQGLISGTSTRRLEVNEARDKFGMEPLTWGLNSRGTAKRGRKYLGWIAKSPSLSDSISDMVTFEGQRKKQGSSSVTEKRTPLPPQLGR